MALKGDRYEAITSIEFFMNQVAERGGIACAITGSQGSGAALDQYKSQVEYATVNATGGTTNVSGRYAIGVLLNDMVNLDLTKQHPNWQRDQMQVGSKVTLLREGWITTNMLASGVVPGLGSGAYVSVSGLLTTDSSNGAPQVGRFETAVDSDGYCRLYVKLPQ